MGFLKRVFSVLFLVIVCISLSISCKVYALQITPVMVSPVSSLSLGGGTGDIVAQTASGGLSWLANGVKESIWGFIFDFMSDVLSKAFALVTDMILTTSDVNKYFNVDKYLMMFCPIAGALLCLVAVWEAFKQQTGNVLPGEEKTFAQIVGQTFVGAFCIFFLPWSVTNIFLKLNNLLIKGIQFLGIPVTEEGFKYYIDPGTKAMQLGGTMIILFLVLAIALFILGIVGGIRYIELLIGILIAPFVAVSAVKSYDAINIWFREMIAVVFTQAVHILLLQVFMVIVMNVSGVMMFVLSIGCLVVMLRGPQVLRTFLYSSGTGSATVGAAGTVGRIGAMKIMMKAVK